ncbi:DUF4097 family beta strand repeat-containing protein [Macrococcus armenti]|uniref:DUF4097 family beta strand repeat-containing protein n=1 Tax=Macrococcus armenti TaxID=2875764 RepID=UPI001CCED4AD|nr:DUF4097 family beta strand repeat-containing protein [Macrococcus armenti]UBH08912.1 DUF4097 domain-containing protein [Macrococcus armenti]UBH11204.1 DUF4097 domain-containing protein [Macrococcus armenti]
MKKFLLFLGIALFIIGIVGMIFTKDQIVPEKQKGSNANIVIDKPFKSIDLDIGKGTIKVMKTNDNQPSIKINNIINKDDYQFKVENNILYLKTKNDTKKQKINFIFGNHVNSDEIEITLLIPNQKLQFFRVNTFAGMIELDDLSTEELEMNAGTGIIQANRILSDNGKINVGIGDISVDEYHSKHTNIDVKTGTIELHGLNPDINIDGNIGLGDGTFEYQSEPQDTHFEVTSQNGDVELNDLISRPKDIAKSIVKLSINTGTVEFDYE